MAPRAVLIKIGLKSFNTARPVNTVRSVNTGRPLVLLVGVRHMTGKPVAIFRFQDLMEVMLLLDEEHWRQISMEKDASYFGDAAPRTDADDGNTADLKLISGSREVSTVVPEVNMLP
ncbi:hypothetical protein Tco_0884382 [Tanacetum coccineum]